MPPEEILNLITPHFSGILDNYWGRNFFKLHTEYIGILPLILAFIGIFFTWKQKETKFFTVWAVFTLIFAFGGHTPIYRVFYHLLWGVSKFRAPAQIFYIFAFSICILAGIGADKLLDGFKDIRRLKSILIGFGTVIFILFFLTILREPIISLGKSLSPDKVKMLLVNIPKLQAGSFLALLFFGISWLLIDLLRKQRIKTLHFGIVSSIFIFFDLWIVDHNFLKTVDPPKLYYAADEIVRFLKTEEDRFRVFPIEYQPGNYLLVHGIENCGGEHGNQLKRYQDFIGASNTVMFRPTRLDNQNMLSVLNVKYLIIPNYDMKKLPRHHPNPFVNSLLKLIRATTDTLNYRIAFRGYRWTVYQNIKVIPRAVIYYNYEVLPEDMVINRLMSSRFNPKSKVILEEDIGLTRRDLPYTPVRIISYQPNQVEMEYRTDFAGILYLSDNYYPMWHATIDGEKTEVLRANYTFRAIKVPAGHHRVRFYFHSPYIDLGLSLFLIGIVATFILPVLPILRIIRL